MFDNNNDLEKDYQESLDYLVNLTTFGMNFGLGRIQELLKRLGNPEKALRVVHVGGTNGKGSTTVMIGCILQEAGYTVGVFTSPHMHDWRERMVINGQMIPKEKVIRAIRRVRPHLEAMVAEGFEHPTEFEVSTALALLYFAEQNVDLALIEVGLGGAIDSTNVVSQELAHTEAHKVCERADIDIPKDERCRNQHIQNWGNPQPSNYVFYTQKHTHYIMIRTSVVSDFVNQPFFFHNLYWVAVSIDFFSLLLFHKVRQSGERVGAREGRRSVECGSARVLMNIFFLGVDFQRLDCHYLLSFFKCLIVEAAA